MSLFKHAREPERFEVSTASHWDKIPFGFFRVQSNGHESLGFHDSVFGVLQDVGPAFRIGALEFRLKKPISELPLVRVRVVILQPGVAHINGRLLLDTETLVRDDAVDYESTAV